MKTLKKILIICGIAMFCMTVGFQQSYAQEKAKTPSLKFLLSGDAYMGLKYTTDSKTDLQTLTFTNMGVNPVFLWKMSESKSSRLCCRRRP
jgi:hypothetical protein